MKKTAKSTMKQRVAKVALRVIELEKKAFDRIAEQAGSLQNRADKMVHKRVEAAKWMPKEGKQLVAEWLHTMKKGRSDLRRAVDVSFDLSAEFVKRLGAPVPVKSPKRAPVARKKSVAQPTAA